MADASNKYKKHFIDSKGVHVPANTYLRGSKHGLVYYLNFTLNGVNHTQCLHVFEQEQDSWVKATNMARRIILTLKARNRDMRLGITEESASAPSVTPQSVVNASNVPRSQRTVNYIVQAYVSHHAQNALKSPTDRPAVRSRAHHLLRLFTPDALVEELEGADIARYIEARRNELLSDSTIKRELSVLECAIKHAKTLKVIPATYQLPEHGVTFLAREANDLRKAKAQDPNIVHTFLNHAQFPERHRLRYKVAYASGLRCHELLNLTPAWLRPLSEGGAEIVLPLHLHAPKMGNDPKRARLDEVTYALLMGHIAQNAIKNDAPIFPADSMMYRDVERVCEAMGLEAPITLRDLRATFGTEMYLANGVDGLAAAQEGLRHKHQAQTATYIKPFTKRVSEWYGKRMLALKPT